MTGAGVSTRTVHRSSSNLQSFHLLQIVKGAAAVPSACAEKAEKTHTVGLDQMVHLHSQFSFFFNFLAINHLLVTH